MAARQTTWWAVAAEPTKGKCWSHGLYSGQIHSSMGMLTITTMISIGSPRRQ